MAVKLAAQGRKQLAIPLIQKVGPEIVQPYGVISYVNGNATPLQLLKVGALAWLDLHFTGTLAWVQAASTAAWTGKSNFPWGLLTMATLQASNRGGFDQSLGGYSAMLRQLFVHPAYTATFSAPLPAANSGTTQTSGNETWDWRQRVYVAMSEADLQGLLFMQSQSSTAYLKLKFAALSDVVTIPTGSSGTLTGQVNVTGYGYGLGQLTATDLSVATVREEVPAGLTQGAMSQQIPLQVGEIVQRIFLQAYVNNVPDTSGQVALDNVELQIGTSRPQVWSADELLFSNQLRDRANLPAGVWVVNWVPGQGTQYKDWRQTPQAFLNLNFSSGTPSGAQMMLLYEFQRLFGQLAG